MIAIFALTFIAVGSIFIDFGSSEKDNKISLDRSIKSKTINSIDEQKLLVYFGHIDLNKSLNIIDKLDNIHKTIFINLSATQSKIDSENILTPELTKSELSNIAREFQIYLDKPILRDTKQNHMPFIYLLVKEGDMFKIRYVYKDLSDEILVDVN